MPTQEIANARHAANMAADIADAEWEKLSGEVTIDQLDAWIKAREARDTAQVRFETLLRGYLQQMQK